MTPGIETWLPRLPESVRAAVAEAVRAATWMKVRRALAEFEACPAEQRGPEVTLHLLSTFNLESIEPALQLGLRCLPCRPNLMIAPLDNIDQQLLDPDSPVYRERGAATVILWRAEELMPDLFFPLSPVAPKDVGHRSREIVDRVKNLARHHAQSNSASLFISTLALPAFSGGTMLDSQLSDGLVATIAQVNAGIFELAAADSRVRVLDVNRWAAAEGASAYDLQMDFLARQPFTTPAAISFAFFLARNIRPLLTPRRKVLVLDLDNTLWGGILGEDGARQLKLGRDFPGSVYLRIQQEILALKHQGVLLVITSKNEEAEVKQAMSELQDMRLKWDDFAAKKINFNPKYQNLREIAAELGLGLDSFVLLDDSDFEREQIKQFTPEVLVLNHRDDALHMLECLVQTDAFDAHHISEEDKKRHQEYALRSARTAPPQANIEDFLRSLELKAKLEPVRASNLERVIQMLGKTNQFNVTTRRHQAEEVQRMAWQTGAICRTLRLVDKFGDQGIVGILLAVPGAEARTMRVDSFLISCRALNRDVEKVLWCELVNTAAKTGIRQINAEYLPTAKNRVVEKIFDNLGLRRVQESAAGTKYRLEPVTPIAPPPWVSVEYLPP